MKGWGIALALTLVAVPALAGETTAQYCARPHPNPEDARYAKRLCEERKSVADPKIPAPIVTRESIAKAAPMTAEDMEPTCDGIVRPQIGDFRLYCMMYREGGPLLAPRGTRNAKLVLRSYRSAYFHSELTYLTVFSPDLAVLQFARRDYRKPWNFHSRKLNAAEIDTFLDALQRSQIWRLPLFAHSGCTDVGFNVEVAMHGWHHQVAQSCDPDVDAGILDTALGQLAERVAH